MWVDATVAAGLLSDPKQSKVADKVGFAQAPIEQWPKGANWLWAWALAIPTGVQDAKDAPRLHRLGDLEGLHQAGRPRRTAGSHVPPGTRKSTYDNPAYQKAAPFADARAEGDRDRRSDRHDRNPKPYVGVQFVGDPGVPGASAPRSGRWSRRR